MKTYNILVQELFKKKETYDVKDFDFKILVIGARVIVRMAFRIAGNFVFKTGTEFSFTLS